MQLIYPFPENSLILPESQNEASYNSSLTLLELNLALHNCNGSSPCPDDLHYSMFKNLCDVSTKYLLNFF